MATVSTDHEATEWLSGLWYLACLSKEVRPGEMHREILFGEPIVLGRTASGQVFALSDVCPHRAAPLSEGRLISGTSQPCQIECPYHGWSFDVGNGACTSVPALSEHDGAKSDGIAVRSYPVTEKNGLLWVYFDQTGDAPSMSAPDLPLTEDQLPGTATIVEAEGPFDEAVLGLVDPAHTPVVHKQWWWRDGAPRREKQKHFEPTELGFKMPAHAPSSNSRIYRMLGGTPTTEIEFRLPGIRLEHIRNERQSILGLTMMTPIDLGMTRITHVIYWQKGLLSVIQPIAQRMSDSFLGQDGNILTAQNKNLSMGTHRPLYLGEPDKPAMWYFQLKKAWVQAVSPADFKNPVKAASLRWRT